MSHRRAILPRNFTLVWARNVAIKEVSRISKRIFKRIAPAALKNSYLYTTLPGRGKKGERSSVRPFQTGVIPALYFASKKHEQQTLR